MSLHTCKTCGGLYTDEPGESFAGFPCSCDLRGMSRLVVDTIIKENADLKAKLVRVEATAKRRLELLRKCEFVPSGFLNMKQCPICRGLYHTTTCPLAAELQSETEKGS